MQTETLSGIVEILVPPPPAASPELWPWLMVPGAMFLVWAFLRKLRASALRRLDHLRRDLARQRTTPRRTAHALAAELRQLAPQGGLAGASRLATALDEIRFRREEPVSGQLLDLIRLARDIAVKRAG